MAGKNPSASLEKWKRRAQAAAGDYKDGVGRVTENPAAKAAASAGKWLSGVQEAAQARRFERGLSEVSLDDWKRQATTKGASNYGTGVSQVSSGKQEKMRQNFQMMESIAQEVRSMPSDTLEERLQRAIAQMRMAHEAKDRT